MVWLVVSAMEHTTHTVSGRNVFFFFFISARDSVPVLGRYSYVCVCVCVCVL
jgi:hypothetical protein